ncbi:MAG: 1-phosphofructokinase [Elainellaceae cyanobacterium]
MPPQIATVTLNPAIDHTASIANFAPGEVNRVTWEQIDPGGKGVNVASFLKDFGFSIAVSGFLGKENSEIFQHFFAEKQLDDYCVRVDGKTRVNIKIVDEVQQQITDINFPGHTVKPEEIQSLVQVLDVLESNYDWFILSGSIPSGVPASIYADLIQQLTAKGKNVLLDASGESFRQAISAAPYAIKPNIHELQELLQTTLETNAEVVQASRDLLAKGIHSIVVSMGAKGAIFVEAEQAVLAQPPAIEVKSTVGAGDAMVAGFTTAKLRNLSLADSARLATAFSLGALSQIGPRLPPSATIEAYMDRVTIQHLD